MWPYESIIKILPDAAMKNVTDIKLPPLPRPQPFIPAKKPNQALQAPDAGAKDNSSSTDKVKNGTSDAKIGENDASNATNITNTGKNATSGNKTVESGANLNKTETGKNESMNSTSIATSENVSSGKADNTKGRNDSKAEESGKSNSTKTESNSEQLKAANLTGNVGEKAEESTKPGSLAEKLPSEGSQIGTSVGKLVDPAKPKNESVVASEKASPLLGQQVSQSHKENAAESKLPQSTLTEVKESNPVQQPKPNSVSQETAILKKPAQGSSEPFRAESSVASEKPNQGGQPAQEKLVQPTEAAKMKKPVLDNSKGQSTALPNEQMGQATPVATEPSITKPLPNDELAKNVPVKGSGMVQSRPVPTEQKAQDSAGQVGTVAQNSPAASTNLVPGKVASNDVLQSRLEENAVLAQNKPAESVIVAQNKPAESAIVAQKKPAESAIVAQNRPAESAIVAQKKPAESAVIAQNKPVENAIVAQKKPAESAVMAQNKPAESAMVAQNKPAESAVMAQNKPAESAMVAQNRPAESAVVAQNSPLGGAIPAQNKLIESSNSPQRKPAENALMAQSKPAESALVTQNNQAPNSNMAKVNSGHGDDLSFDLFGDDASPSSTQQADKLQEKVAIGNGMPAIGPNSANPQLQSNKPMNIEEANEVTGPVAEQNPPLTHEKMIELSSPPITNLGHTNFATNKDLHVPFRSTNTELNRPGKVVNQFIGAGTDQGRQESAVKQMAPKQDTPEASEADGLESIFSPAQSVMPTAPSIVKPVTPLKPTLATKKSPETLEEFENERLVKQGLAPSMNEGLLKALPSVSNEGKPKIDAQNNSNSFWVEDFGLLGDAPWVRNKAPSVPNSDEKAKDKGDEDKKAEEKKQPEKGEKDKDKKEAKKDEEKEVTSDKTEAKNNEGKGKTEKTEGKVDNENSTRKNKTEGSKEEKTEKISDTEKSKKEDSKTEVTKDGKPKNTAKQDKDESKDSNKTKEKDSKTIESNQTSNETENVVHSKASYQYIENKTTTLDNHEYHESLGKNNETDGNTKKANNTATNQEPIQAQNLVPDQNRNKTQPIGFAAKQNAWPNSKDPINSPAQPASQQMTSAGDVHQISSALPVSSALPLAALPISSSDHPQFFVSSPVSNQTTTTTTSLLPVDPKTGDHVLNTSLVLVAMHGDVGTIPESSITGSDQVDWMKKNAPKESVESAMNGFVPAKKAQENMEYSIDDIGKKKSSLRPKSVVPNSEREKRKMMVMQDAAGSKVIKKSMKRDTFNKIQKALEGTNLTIQNGVSSHMTFKSFVPRLSIDDIVDEQKRSSIPSSEEKQGKVKSRRSWEKNLGNVIGALEGTNFSMQNEVASQLTFKSNVEPVTLIKTKKLQKILGDIGGMSKEGANGKGGTLQGGKEKHASSANGLMNSKGGKSKSKKLTKKKKESKVPSKGKKTIKEVKKKEVSKKQKASNKRKRNLRTDVKSLKKFAAKQIQSISNENGGKRSKTGNSHFSYKTDSHKVPLKGANHSEANIISTFSGTKNAKETKSVTITNAGKASANNAKNENGTLEVDTKAQDVKNGTEDRKETPKSNPKESKARENGSLAELGNSTKTLGKDDENRRNSTAEKPPERGVFEPDIGTMKKMPETTDIKHHIVGTSEKENHTSTVNEAAETLVRGNLTEQKIVDNNTLFAVYNVRRIDEGSNGNSTNLLLKNIQAHHIDGNNTLSVVYNTKPTASNGTNSTSKTFKSNLEEHHVDDDSVLHTAYSSQKAQKKGSVENSKVRGVKVHRHKAETSKWKNPKVLTSASNGAVNVPTSAAGRGKWFEKGTRGKMVSSKKGKHQVFGSKSSKESNTKEKNEKESKKEEKENKKADGSAESSKKRSKDIKSHGSGKKKSDSEGPLSIKIKGNAEKTKPKKLKRIGLVLPEKNRKSDETKKLKTASDKKIEAKVKGDASKDYKGNDKSISGTEGAHEKVQKDTQNESKAAVKKVKNVKKGIGKGNKSVMDKSAKQRIKWKVKLGKKDLKKVGVQIKKLLKKIKKIANIPIRNTAKKQKGNVKSRKEKRKGKPKTAKDDEERLKEIQKRKKVHTIFFPQIFMKRTHIPNISGNHVAKASRQLIPTQVGNIEPSKGATQNSAAGQEQVSKSSDKPNPEKENGNKTQPGSALYENNKTMNETKNKSGDAKGDQGSKNSGDGASDIDKVLNLTVGFLNKTFHDHFGKGAHEKDKVNVTNDKVGQNATNDWSSSKQNGTSNVENGTKNGTSDGVTSFKSAQNETKSGNNTITNGPNLVANATSMNNNTETGNITTAPLGSSMQNFTNQIGNSAAENQTKPLNNSGGFRSERIPGVSKAAAVSDMMSPIENYILNIINETGREKFGNQSIPEGKRASTKSNETSTSGMDNLAALLSKANGKLSLKSNEVNIKLTPKGSDKSTRTITEAKAGAGMLLNITSKRSKLSRGKAKGKQQNKSKGKGRDKIKPTKLMKATKNMSSKSVENKAANARLRPLSKHERPTAKTNQKAAATKSRVKFASTHKTQKVMTISKGPVTLGFANKVVGATKQRVKERKGDMKKSPEVKDEVSKKNAKETKAKVGTSVKVVKHITREDNGKEKDIKHKKEGKKMKRQISKDNSNENQNSGSLPVKIDGQKIDWGPVSENWPNYGSG